MAISIEDLMAESACFCSSGGSTAERTIMALLQRIAEAGGGGGGGAPGGPVNAVQFQNPLGVFSGSAELTFNDTTNVLQLIGSQNILQVVSNVTALTIAGHALSGANAQSMISGAGTWNTTGNPVALRFAITDTASGATSKFLEFLGGAGGATSAFSVDRIGNLDITTIGALTASAPALEITQTWNNAAVAFTGISFDVTDTASSASSMLLDLKVGGATQASLSKVGSLALNGACTISSGQVFQWAGRSMLASFANGNIILFDAATSDFGLLQFGGVAATFPAIKRSTTILQARLADDSAFTAIQAILQTSVNATAAAPPVTTHTIPITDAAGQVYRVPCLV